ncbi:MAG: hypothetical protein M0R06_00405 [Sphaerochaeta sp.]|nr:hypothetical protein [Sphaerochaeta sp.]
MGKTLTTMLADLRIDLKDAATGWSDAELTRCIKRAVGDYSRFAPLQRTYETTVDQTVTDESFTTPATSDTDYIVDNKDISASVAGEACTLAASVMDTARPVIVTVTDADSSISVLILTIKGNDADGLYQEELFNIANGKVQTLKKYFSVVTSVTITAITGNGAADALDIGTGSTDGVWVSLANYPIQFQSETFTGYTLDTDYEMDYRRGRICMKSGGTLAAGTAYTISYTKSSIMLNLDSVPDVMRIERIEWPAGAIPQTYAEYSVWNNIVILKGSELGSQTGSTDAQHIVLEYLTQHTPPTTESGGSYPSFLDFTIELDASAYALMIESLQYDLQAVTDFASARTILSTTISHTKTGVALDAANTAIDNINALFAKVGVALDAATSALGTSATYLTGATAPSAKYYLETGDGFIEGVPEGTNPPGDYATYAQRSSELSSMLLSEAQMYLSEASARMAEADQRGSEGNAYATEAQSRIAEIDRLIQEADMYVSLATQNMLLADKYRNEANERRNEAWAIWNDSAQYAPMYSLGMSNQPAA